MASNKKTAWIFLFFFFKVSIKHPPISLYNDNTIDNIFLYIGVHKIITDDIKLYCI